MSDSDEGRANAGKGNAAKRDAPRGNVRDQGVPAQLQYIAVAVGLLIFIIGAASVFRANAYTVGVNLSALMMCAGLGIVLAAFGSHVEGTWHNWRVAGAAGGALVLFLAQYETMPKVLPTLRGELYGTNAFQSVAMWGTGPLFVSRRRTEGNFEFAIFPDDIEHSSELMINVTKAPGSEFYIYCIPTELIGTHLGEMASMGLTLRASPSDGTVRVYDRNNKPYGKFNDDDCDASPTSAASGKAAAAKPLWKAASRDDAGRRDWIVGALGIPGALAQTLKPWDDKSGDAHGADIVKVIGELNSGDPNVRIWARKQLSSASDPSDFKELGDTWDVASSSYLDDLGRLVAWNNSAKTDAKAGTKILSTLDDEKLKYVLDLTGHPDLTMRTQATSLVGKLLLTSATPGDATPDRSDAFWRDYLAALRTAGQAAPEKGGAKFLAENKVYNNLVALDGVACQMPKNDKKADIAAALTSYKTNNSSTQDLDVKSKTLADKILLEIDGKCPSP